MVNNPVHKLHSAASSCRSPCYCANTEIEIFNFLILTLRNKMKLPLCTNCIGKLFMSNNVDLHFAYSDKKFDALICLYSSVTSKWFTVLYELQSSIR